MPTPDRKPGVSFEEGQVYEDEGIDPNEDGEVRFSNGEFKMQDSIGVFNPRLSGGISEAQHNALRVLIHLADSTSRGGPFEGFASNAFFERTGGLVFPTSETWYVDATKVEKIVEKTITYAGAFPSVIEWKAYDTDGTTVLVTVTDTITRTGAFETSRTRTIV